MSDLVVRLVKVIEQECDDFILREPEATNIDVLSAVTMVLAHALVMSKAKKGHDPVGEAQAAIAKAYKQFSMAMQ